LSCWTCKFLVWFHRMELGKLYPCCYQGQQFSRLWVALQLPLFAWMGLHVGSQIDQCGYSAGIGSWMLPHMNMWTLLVAMMDVNNFHFCLCLSPM
jgi:hypothetical protein